MHDFTYKASLVFGQLELHAGMALPTNPDSKAFSG